MSDMVKSGLAVENDDLNPSSALNNLLGTTSCRRAPTTWPAPARSRCDYLGVRQAITDAENPMFSSGASPKSALAAAECKANSVLAADNARVGG